MESGDEYRPLLVRRRPAGGFGEEGGLGFTAQGDVAGALSEDGRTVEIGGELERADRLKRNAEGGVEGHGVADLVVGGVGVVPLGQMQMHVAGPAEGLQGAEAQQAGETQGVAVGSRRQGEGVARRSRITQ